jgi:hypothetical protein
MTEIGFGGRIHGAEREHHAMIGSKAFGHGCHHRVGLPVVLQCCDVISVVTEFMVSTNHTKLGVVLQ